MIKVVCISPSLSSSQLQDYIKHYPYNYKPLVFGEIYDANEIITSIGGVSTIDPVYYIVNGFWERKDFFITMDEHREKQLNKLGIYESDS